MNKFQSGMEVFFASGIIAYLSGMLGSNSIPFMILIILVLIDTLTGMAKAIKLKHFCSRGLLKFAKKVILYSTSILTVSLLEIGIRSVYNTNLFSQTMAIFFILSEAVSILENMEFLGVPIPANFIKLIMKIIKVPGVDKFGETSKNSLDGENEIDDMIKYHLPRFQNKNARNLIEIKLKVWKGVVEQISKSITDNDLHNEELLYYKVMYLMEMGFKDMQYQWEEANIPKEYIEQFNGINQARNSKLMQNIKSICYAKEVSDEVKKQRFIDSIVVILYQTILEALKL